MTGYVLIIFEGEEYMGLFTIFSTFCVFKIFHEKGFNEKSFNVCK